MKTKGFKKILAFILMFAMVIQLLPAMKYSEVQAATEYVRIKNVWQNTYLYQDGDRVTYGKNVSVSDQKSQWQLINVPDGTVRIKNRATGNYMHIENLRGYVQCGNINEDWTSARWLKQDAGNGQVRFGNYWQRSQYMHVENLNGNVQSGNIYDVWSSAKWVVERIEEETTTPAPTTTKPAPTTTTKAPETTTKAPETTTKAPEATTKPAQSVTTTYKAGDRTHCRAGGGASQDGNGVGNLHLGGAYAEFYNIDGGNGGKTEIVVHYATQDGNPEVGVYVNNNFTMSLRFSSTGGWGTYTGTYKFNTTLKKGNNTIKFEHRNLGVNISSIDVTVNKSSQTEETTKTPETTTKAPETTTKAPETTTKAPETTTKVPETTTKAPETTTKAPETTTQGEYGNPDLVVSEIYCEPQEVKTGNSVTFKAKVTNVGTASTKAGVVAGVRFSVDSLNSGTYTWSDTHTSSIKPGESVVLTANGGSNGNKWYAAAGSHTIYAWVDDVNRISESNENNNTTTKSINVTNESSGGDSGNTGGDGGNTGGDSGNTGGGSTEKGDVIGYPVPAGKSTSSSVTMTANGVNVGVFDTPVNNTHQWVDSYYPALSTAEVGIFDFKGAAEVKMTVNYRVNNVTVRPVNDGIRPNITYNGNTSYITFTITKAGQYSVELNNNLTDATLIFASDIEPEPTGNVIKIARGQAHYGNINVGSGQTLYIEGGATVFGRVFCASNSTVKGRGIIDGSHLDTWHGSNGQYPMSIEFASNVNVSGVAVLNSNCWNYQIYNSSNVHLDNIKIVSARPNGDGVSIQSSDQVYINNSFIRTWDDGIVLKNYSNRNTHDVYVENCRLWTDLAQSMEIGFETNAGYGGYNGSPAIYNVKFNNVNVFHALHKAPISIHNGDNAEIHHITWSNVTIEDCSVGQGDGWNLWLDFTNVPAGNIPGAYGGWTHNYNRGTIHDITLNNINVLSSSTTNYRVWANGNGDIYNIYANNAFTYR